MDTSKRDLETVSTRELVEELNRRITKLESARALLLEAVPSGSSPAKNPRISGAKAKYWQGWHDYQAAHPDATVAEWRKSLKPTRKASAGHLGRA